MKLALAFAILIATIGGCAIVPYDRAYHSDGYYRGDGHYRGGGYRGDGYYRGNGYDDHK